MITRVLIALPLLFVACREEPELLCEGIRFGWPAFQIDPSSDVSASEGIQINLEVGSDLLPGSRANLFVTPGTEDDREAQVFVGDAIAGAQGQLSFSDVGIPLGSIIFIIEAEDACGKARGGRRTYVWDGQGQPQCELSLATEPDPVSESLERELGPEHDEDPTLAGMQVEVLIEAGRPDMQVSLFAVDRETGDTRNFELGVDQLGVAQQSLTLPQGEQALRAICYWPVEDFRVTTPTRVYRVSD